MSAFFSKVIGLFSKPEPEPVYMADEIGFHAIWNPEFHNCRPTSWAAGEDYLTGRGRLNPAELSYAGQVNPL